jgi:CheY-like chemotaxis protein
MTKHEKAPAVPIVIGLPHYTTKAPNPRHILVVEDSLDSVHTMVLLLRDMGHVVDYAINGYAAIDLARRMRPEFILLDIGLPGLDGYDVCKRIKADATLNETKVVVVTAYAGEEYRERSRAAGCHLHLIKPVPVHVLERLFA